MSFTLSAIDIQWPDIIQTLQAGQAEGILEI